MMFTSFKSIANKGKDTVVALTVKHLVNHKLSQKMQNVFLETLEIDSTKKNIAATLSLPEAEFIL